MIRIQNSVCNVLKFYIEHTLKKKQITATLHKQ